MMNKYQYKSYGNASDVLEKIQSEIPKIETLHSNQVLIKNYATSINAGDVRKIIGTSKMIDKTMPCCPCSDVAGEVAGIGKDVTKFKVGDFVWGSFNGINSGALSEYLILKETEIALKPESLSFAEAGAFPLAFTCSYQGLVDYAHMKSGDKVLINGGASSTGLAGIQIARILGASEIWVTSSHEDLVRKVGATHVINYKLQNWWEVLKGKAIDVLLDCAGGAYSHCKEVLNKRTGRYAGMIHSNDQNSTVDIGFMVGMFGWALKGKAKQLFGGPKFSFIQSKYKANQMEIFTKWGNENQLRPMTDKQFTFDESAKAFDFTIQAKQHGKVVIVINSEKDESLNGKKE